MLKYKKKNKNKTEKMFKSCTAILSIYSMFVFLSTLHSHTTEGKVQINHRHHAFSNRNSNQHDKNNADIDTKHHHHHHQHHHQHHHHHELEHLHAHKNHHESQQRKYAATPILEFTTSSSSSAIQSDNEFLIQQPENIQDTQLINKDEIHYKTMEHKSLTSSTSSTTSQPTFSNHFHEQNDHKIKLENLLNTSVVHTRYTSHYNRSIPMVMLKHQLTDIGNSQSDSDNMPTTTITDPYGNSKLNQTFAKQSDQYQHQHRRQEQLKTNETHKPEYDRKPDTKYIYEDYYGDDDGYENDHNDDELDTDENEYIDEDDKDNIDNIAYDENYLSDRSYARIIRSKFEDDYAEDEPYRNGLNDLQMQSDAAPGVLTEQKYLEVGNDKAVQQARERYVQEQKRPRTPHELATEHWHRMIQATKCRKPLPRVIPVSNNTSKRYEPYATILHRCGDDTGCCGSTASVCTVKRYETVMVYVFSYDFNYRKEIEALPMQNHTECHCVNRGSLLHDSIPRDKRSGGSYLKHFQRQQKRQQPELQTYAYSQYPVQQKSQMQNTFNCHCPRHFNVFEEDIERHANLPRPHNVFIRKCRCDCVISNETCLRFKNGEEGFSLEDRKCIQERDCKPPVCLYGDYNSRNGRCPSYRSTP